MKRAAVLYAMLALAMAGVVDTLYLTLLHYRGTAPNCVLLEGCDVVTASEYASMGPVPLSLLGLLYYVVLVVLVWMSLLRERVIRILAALSGLGFVFSLYLLYLQVAVIGALCVYCLISLATSALIFGFSLSFFSAGFRDTNAL